MLPHPQTHADHRGLIAFLNIGQSIESLGSQLQLPNPLSFTQEMPLLSGVYTPFPGLQICLSPSGLYILNIPTELTLVSQGEIKQSPTGKQDQTLEQ